MASSEFTRIVRNLSQLGEIVHIKVRKEGVRFASETEAANGNDGNELFWQGGGTVIPGGKITAVKEKAVDEEEAEGSMNEKKGKKKVEEKSDEDKEDDAEFRPESDDDEGGEEEDEEGRARKR